MSVLFRSFFCSIQKSVFVEFHRRVCQHVKIFPFRSLLIPRKSEIVLKAHNLKLKFTIKINFLAYIPRREQAIDIVNPIPVEFSERERQILLVQEAVVVFVQHLKRILQLSGGESAEIRFAKVIRELIQIYSITDIVCRAVNKLLNP